MKPREFWILDQKEFPEVGMRIKGSALFATTEKPVNPPNPLIHVIEKSAYDSLVKEYSDLFAKRTTDALEYTQLKEQAEKLAAVIKSVNFTCHWYAINHKGPDHEVHHALKVELAHETDEALADYEKFKEMG